ncbi:MAG: PEP-CTERM sorting domain-containing protein [Nostoc sp.]|uniref:PEP-CTERM sorting domain-containing protein n=1 Tax=Nostoc sp. TaxID=1180 RepID=UPI002FF60684
MISKKISTKIAYISAICASINIVAITKTPTANAASLSIANAGFEEPIIGEGDFTINVLPGWTLYDPSNLTSASIGGGEPIYGAYNPTADVYFNEAPEGNNVGYVYLTYPPGSGAVGISQTLPSLLTANTKYTLQVEIANIPPVNGFTTLDGFPGYAIQLLAGGTLLSQDYNNLSITEGAFVTSSISYISLANNPNLGKPLEIRLLNLLQSDGIEINFDNVKLNATQIPEPASILGITLGFLGAGLTLKKKND